MRVELSKKVTKNQISFKSLIAQFQEIKQHTFSGNLIIHIESTPRWVFSFSLGQLVGISGGIDPVNRWQRNLGVARLDLTLDRLVRPNIRGEQFLNSNILTQQAVIVEVLFDIIQFSQRNGDRLNIQLIAINSNKTTTNSRLPLIDIEVVLGKAIRAWKNWLQAGFDRYIPSHFPIITQGSPMANDELNSIISGIDGNQSLRSLAIENQQYLLTFTKTLSPLIETGAVILSPYPKSQTKLVTNLTTSIPDSTPVKIQPTIACIDDSVLVYRHLEQILTEHGYLSFGIQEAAKIMPGLIKHKPDLIFLDLLMPISNGYEVCEQIRRTPTLKHIPVVILTGKDGLIDRMRSKLVGANGFLSKPVSRASVLKMIDKHLHHH